MKKIAIYLAEGFEETEAIAIIDILRRAEFEVNIISITNSLEVTGAHNIIVRADVLFGNTDYNYNTVDMIILPGGMPGTRNLQAHQGLRSKILEFYKQNKYLGAICAAPLIFGDLGILKNKKATCYPGFEEELTGAEITGREVEQSGKIITGKGVGVAIDFALKIVEELCDKNTANNLAQKCIVKE